jgi:hypothetical protein
MDEYKALIDQYVPDPGPAPIAGHIFGIGFGETARQQWEQANALRNSLKQYLVQEKIKQELGNPFRNATLAELALVSGKRPEELALPSQIKIDKELTPSAVPHFSISDVTPSIRPMSLGYNLAERPQPPILRPRFTPEEMAGLERMAPEEFYERYGVSNYIDREELLAKMRTDMDSVKLPPSTGIEPFLREAPRMQVTEQPGAPHEITTRTVDPNTPLSPAQQAFGRAMLEREGKWPRQHAMNQWEMLATAFGLPSAAELVARNLGAQAAQREAAANLAKSGVDVNEARAKDYLARVGLTEAQKDRIRQLVDAQQALLEAQADLARQRASGSKTQTDIAQQRLNFDKYKFATMAKYVLSTQNLPDEIRDEILRDALRTLGIDVSDGMWENALEKYIAEFLGTRAKIGKVPSPFEPGAGMPTQQTKPQEQQTPKKQTAPDLPDLSQLPPGNFDGQLKRDTVTGNIAKWNAKARKWEWLPPQQ